MSKKRLLIVGGVAGGASCAARARRLSEEAEIIIFERGSYISYANCGLPYYVGNVIPSDGQLLMATPEFLKGRLNIDVRVGNEVLAVDCEKAEVRVKDLKTGAEYSERYDALVLSPGAVPIRPPLPGVDLPGIFCLRTIPDSRQIREWIAGKNAKRAVVVGGGFVGLEMTENLVKRGLSVTLVEMEKQVAPSFDPEMAVPVHDCLTDNGVHLCLGEPVSGFGQNADGTITVRLDSGESHTADIVMLSIGVRPETALAEAAGLEIGEYGGIRVDEQMRTSDERIWAVGDAVEVRHIITGDWGLFQLAGPASRQGRMAADVIFGRDVRFRGVQATAVCGIFGTNMASTGASEKMLTLAGAKGKPMPYEKVYLHPGNHARYYPGAWPIAMKLIFSTKDGCILGAQATGQEGVEKRIDVIAMAIQRNSTVFDLEEAELCYAPQFGAAKDPVNMAGMVAANTMRGDAPIVHCGDMVDSDAMFLDVRSPEEVEVETIPGALNIPLPEVRRRLAELPRDREIWVYCRSGFRSYYATRTLLMNGFKARNVSGGLVTCAAVPKFAEWQGRA
jgi:NADPH-dependent 2,4-dienoyl-CoA reductase/sulfur reductase-like enzyme/rhodanese-related sulfurtransferase